MLRTVQSHSIMFVLLVSMLVSCGDHESGNSLVRSDSVSDSSSRFDVVRLDRVFLENDTSRNCYSIIYPEAGKMKGLVVLLPGFSETAYRVLQQTTLPADLAKSGYLTVIPTLQDGVLSFGIDSSSQRSLQRIVDDVREKNELENLPFFIGGYSIGGSCAIKYAQESGIKPDAVFAIDPPVDFEQMYKSNVRAVRLAGDDLPNEESVFIIHRVEELMGGKPEDVIQNYYAVSPYSYSDTSQSGVRKLLHVALRIYTEPDVHWWMKERGNDYTGMNSTFHSAMINELNRLGNIEAFLITTTNKGYREPDHQRHPHSWSIVDNKDLIMWLEKQSSK